jgi:hypothetical protein
MNPRRLVILLVAGLVIIAVALWLSSQRHLERSIVAGQPVLPDLRPALNSVNEVRLIKGDGSRTTLKKRESDWVVAERDYPADSGRVRKLLLDLADLKVVEEKTRDPANYPKLGVEDVTVANASGTKVEIADGKKPVDLIVGKSAGMKSGYVRVPSAQQSLLAAPQIIVDADPKRWLDRTLLDIAQERVKEVAVTPATGPAYTVTRASKDQADFTIPNLPKGRTLASNSAPDPVAGSLAALTLDDVRKAGAASTANANTPKPLAIPTKADNASGAESSPISDAASSSSKVPAGSAAAKAEGPAHAVFQTFDGLTLDVTGRKDGDRHFVTFNAKSSAKETEKEAQSINTRVQGWEIEIPSYKYDAMFRPLEESLAKVEEPAKKDAAKSGGKDKKKAS